MASEVKRIKIVTDIFDDEKMLLIEALPEHDAIIVIWFKLLCLAGKQNNSGVFMMNDKIAYTDEMLATIFRRPLNTVRLALETFRQYGMVEIVDNIIVIPNWGKHQSLDKIVQRREYMKNYMANNRSGEKKNDDVVNNRNVNSVLTEINVNSTEREEDKEIEQEEDKDIKTSPQSDKSAPDCPYKKIMDLYNSICLSYPRIVSIEGRRKISVKARWTTYPSLDTFEKLFSAAEASSFMKGNNDRVWSANFDWMMCATNMPKVLEGKYDDCNRRNKADAENPYSNLEGGLKL